MFALRTGAEEPVEIQDRARRFPGGRSSSGAHEDFALTELATDRLIADWRAANPRRTLRWPGFGRALAEVIRLSSPTSRSTTARCTAMPPNGSARPRS
ncbi:hypothetical protein ACFOSC_09860 [Streptantibioticus rubrisoli]|uniref:Uncharacterized protein n=1 Tax=Streptantibioticus rubrisoli TaxID=1387313 RepID=A0ABT1P9J5_9ACTN|nr:hypothetical protein [Streptantibioticus rubrisoli]MCQ4041010.1 hypothetical protein [Streptantibioticus rubrisoli]